MTQDGLPSPLRWDLVSIGDALWLCQLQAPLLEFDEESVVVAGGGEPLDCQRTSRRKAMDRLAHQVVSRRRFVRLKRYRNPSQPQ